MIFVDDVVVIGVDLAGILGRGTRRAPKVGRCRVG